jgi:hypothetical protein
MREGGWERLARSADASFEFLTGEEGKLRRGWDLDDKAC